MLPSLNSYNTIQWLPSKQQQHTYITAKLNALEQLKQHANQSIIDYKGNIVVHSNTNTVQHHNTTQSTQFSISQTLLHSTVTQRTNSLSLHTGIVDGDGDTGDSSDIDESIQMRINQLQHSDIIDDIGTMNSNQYNIHYDTNEYVLQSNDVGGSQLNSDVDNDDLQYDIQPMQSAVNNSNSAMNDSGDDVNELLDMEDEYDINAEDAELQLALQMSAQEAERHNDDT